MNLFHRIVSLLTFASLFVLAPAIGRALLLWWDKQRNRSLPSQHIALAISTMVALTGLFAIYGVIWKANPKLVAWYDWMSRDIPIAGDVSVSGSVSADVNEPLKVEIVNP
jgi:hypothetical protein